MSINDRMNAVMMGMRMMGAGMFSKAPRQTIARAMQQIFMPQWSEPPKKNSGQWIDLYMKSPRMAPVHKIASDVATAEYKLLVKGTKPEVQIENHISLDLLARPCPIKEFNGYHLMYLTEVYKLLPTGEAFWLLERNFLGTPVEIWLVPPHWVMETPTSDKPYYTIIPRGNVKQGVIYVDPGDVVWFKEPNPLNPYGRGRGRAEAIGDEIEADEYMAKYQKRFFFNDAVPPMIGVMEGADKAALETAEEKWQQKFGGFNNSHKVAWVNWDPKLKVLKETHKEMDFSQSRKDLRDACNQFWNMPPELFGILENSNRSTIDAAYYIYTKNTLSVRLKILDMDLNNQFFSEFDSKLIIRHDNVVPEDKEFELKKDTEGLKYSAIMVDEWRHSQGKTDLPDNKGKILYVPLNMIPYPIEDDIEGLPNQQQDEGPPGKEVHKGCCQKKYTEEHKTAIWKNFDKAAVKYERKVESEVKKYFQGQQDRLVKAFEKSYSNIITKEETDDPDELLDWAAEATALVGILKPFWLKCAEEGFNVAAELLNIDFEFGIIEPKLLKWIKEHGLERANGMNDTTKEALRKTLSEGIEAGESMAKLRDRISQVYSTAKTSRANTIARTETMTTVNVGNFETMNAAGIEKIMWLTSKDNRVRDSHAALDGEVIESGQTFSNGLRYPNDEGPADEVVNCRCTIIVPDEE